MQCRQSSNAESKHAHCRKQVYCSKLIDDPHECLASSICPSGRGAHASRAPRVFCRTGHLFMCTPWPFFTLHFANLSVWRRLTLTRGTGTTTGRMVPTFSGFGDHPWFFLLWTISRKNRPICSWHGDIHDGSFWGCKVECHTCASSWSSGQLRMCSVGCHLVPGAGRRPGTGAAAFPVGVRMKRSPAGDAGLLSALGARLFSGRALIASTGWACRRGLRRSGFLILQWWLRPSSGWELWPCGAFATTVASRLPTCGRASWSRSGKFGQGCVNGAARCLRGSPTSGVLLHVTWFASFSAVGATTKTRRAPLPRRPTSLETWLRVSPRTLSTRRSCSECGRRCHDPFGGVSSRGETGGFDSLTSAFLFAFTVLRRVRSGQRQGLLAQCAAPGCQLQPGRGVQSVDPVGGSGWQRDHVACRGCMLCAGVTSSPIAGGCPGVDLPPSRSTCSGVTNMWCGATCWPCLECSLLRRAGSFGVVILWL